MSIVEIAQKAQVSISTVSRYFNRPETVSPKIAERIREVAEQANYQLRVVRPGPKGAARIGIRSGVIALIPLREFEPEAMWRMPALPVLIGSIQQTLLRKQLSLYLGHLDAKGRLPECVLARKCDGIIFFSKPNNQEAAERFQKTLPDLPAVWCFREHLDENNRFDHVFYDNSGVGTQAADYLVSRGCRKLAIFNTTPDHRAFQERQQTFLSRCAALGIPAQVFTAQVGDAGSPQVFATLAARFVREGNGCDGAFFCVDQDMLGIHIELLKLGIAREQLVMVGCNADAVALQYIRPRPATIDIKIAQIGQMAVDQLLRRINGDCQDATNEIFIKPELIQGENVK